jgi:hypothetical protein
MSTMDNSLGNDWVEGKRERESERERKRKRKRTTKRGRRGDEGEGNE